MSTDPGNNANGGTGGNRDDNAAPAVESDSGERATEQHSTNDPGTNDLDTSDPGTNDPDTNDPGSSDGSGGNSEPSPPDPGQPDPGQPDPGQPDPGQPDPGKPAVDEPAPTNASEPEPQGADEAATTQSAHAPQQPSPADQSPGSVAEQESPWEPVTHGSHLDNRRHRRQRRTRRNLITLGVILALTAAVLIAAWQSAGRLGVPGFSYTNDAGSQCRNEFLGYTCAPITMGELNHWAGTSFDEDLTIFRSSLSDVQGWRVAALVEVPASEVESTSEMLEERFGSCDEIDADSPPDEIPDDSYTDLCRSSNTTLLDDEGDQVDDYSDLIRATREDDSMLVRVVVFSV